MLPENYTLHYHNTIDDPAWDDFENVACDAGIGFDVPKDNMRGALIQNPDGKAVGVMWTEIYTGRSQPPNTLGFHIAVADEEQGNGLGSILLVEMQKDLVQRRIDNPQLSVSVYVVNTILRDALYRRGFEVTEDLRERENEETYVMQDQARPLQKLTDIFLAHPIAFDKALAQAADHLQLPLYEWKEKMRSWADDPNTTLNTLEKTALSNSIQALPTNIASKQFLWHQLHKNSQDIECPIQDEWNNQGRSVITPYSANDPNVQETPEPVLRRTR
jgi:ribosomal protein S18 acetylase RimI-like enzyme